MGAAVGAVWLSTVISRGPQHLPLSQPSLQRSRAQVTQKSHRCISVIISSVRRGRAACCAAASQDKAQQHEEDELYMAMAVEEARRGAALGEVPVGAVLIHDGSMIARSHNLVERLRDPTAHAEMLVIRQAAAQGLGRWTLQTATLYATLEPCAMCAGAILISRVGTVVYGARSTLLGADGTWMQLLPCQHDAEGAGADSSGQGAWQGRPHPTHPNIQVRRGVLSEESGAMLKAFFQQRRAEGKSRAAEIGSIVPHLDSESDYIPSSPESDS